MIAVVLALSFAGPVGFAGNNALDQYRRRPTRKLGIQAKRPARELHLRSYEFDTVTVDARGKITDRRKGTARYYVEDINGVGLEMVEIPGGSFTMGSSDWGPVHPVNVPPFYMGKYEVTQPEWKAVAKLPRVSRDLNPETADFKGDSRPVEEVSWLDALEFCARLFRATGRIYRLPSEAEWEYACRAGTTTEFAFGETITPEIVNYDGNEPYGKAPKGMERKRTTPVGSLGVANGFGLFDMHGNVPEWCLDSYHREYDGAPTDGSAWVGKGGEAIVRGGDFRYGAKDCRSDMRNSYGKTTAYTGLGFRVAAATRTDVAVLDFLGSQEERAKSPTADNGRDDIELQHKWHIEEGSNGVNYLSECPAPVPFSYSEEPEATLAIEAEKISGRPRILSEVVNSEIRDIRKEIQIGPYLEEDGHQAKANIASYVEEIEGQKVAFIKYRTVGVKGEPRAMPRSVRHALLIKNGKLTFVHLTVLFAKHQEEVRADQMRLIKSIIRK